MRETISFPHLGNYYIPIRYLFRRLTNIKVMPSPPITKRTIELGTKYSPDSVCVPFKYNLGNFIESLDNGATILFQAGGGCRYRYYAEVQEQILRDLGYNFKFYKLVSGDALKIREMYRLFRELNENLGFAKFIHVFILTFFYIYYMDKIAVFIRENVGFEKTDSSFSNLEKKCIKTLIKLTVFFLLLIIILNIKSCLKRSK